MRVTSASFSTSTLLSRAPKTHILHRNSPAVTSRPLRSRTLSLRYYFSLCLPDTVLERFTSTYLPLSARDPQKPAHRTFLIIRQRTRGQPVEGKRPTPLRGEPRTLCRECYLLQPQAIIWLKPLVTPLIERNNKNHLASGVARCPTSDVDVQRARLALSQPHLSA